MQQKIHALLDGLEKSLVATPKDRATLEEFANANNGSNDFLLMQMSMQFGYKIALEELNESLDKDTITSREDIIRTLEKIQYHKDKYMMGLSTVKELYFTIKQEIENLK